MKIPSNRVSSVIKYYRDQLSELYSREEIENFIFFSFSEYMDFSRTDLLSRKEETMSESMLLKFNFAVKALKQHKPIQYILGSTEFYGLKIKVDERVLIPRPETEELVHVILQDEERRHKSQESRQESQDAGLNTATKILDIGTGSGCIAIALSRNITGARVSAMDVSEGALELAKENAKDNNADVEFIHADVLKDETAGRLGTYHIIVSNPPYVLGAEKGSMHPNVLDNEPHLALFVNDNDPLLFYRRIMELGKQRLEKNGMIYFEINEQQGEALKRLAHDKGYSDIVLQKDLSGKDRILSIKLK
jgi:release factor glutamine methyltransferase